MKKKAYWKMSEEIKKFSDINPLVFSQILMMMAGQVCMNTMVDLEKTPAYRKRVKETGNQFLIALDQNLQKDINRLYNTDDTISLDLCKSISNIAKVVANCKNPTALVTISRLLDDGIDLDKVKLTEYKRGPYNKK